MDQTEMEERWNTLSHVAGAALGIIGFFVLLKFDTGKSPYSTFSLIVYSVSLVVLFSASSIYHYVKGEDRKLFWRKIDHISIYYLIAGTYTPVALITLVQDNGWIIFWVVWIIATLGTLLKIFYTGKFELLSLLLYLGMGWLIMFDISGLLNNLNFEGLMFLLLGGAFYTIGAIFYAIKKIPYNHVIWHFFVLGGAISHFFMILIDVI